MITSGVKACLFERRIIQPYRPFVKKKLDKTDFSKIIFHEAVLSAQNASAVRSVVVNPCEQKAPYRVDICTRLHSLDHHC